MCMEHGIKPGHTSHWIMQDPEMPVGETEVEKAKTIPRVSPRVQKHLQLALRTQADGSPITEGRDNNSYTQELKTGKKGYTGY